MSLEIANRIIFEMNLRKPQAESLLKFHRLLQLSNVNLANNTQSEIRRAFRIGELSFPDQYARLTFALATGVGKTRLMGALIAYLFLTGQSRNFVLMAPSSTIYDKLKREAVPTHPKYLFGGLTGFPLPEVYHAENAETCRFEQQTLWDRPRLFIFTPSQIRPRSGSEAERRLRRENEIWGQSFVGHLSNLSDLVICLDEGHRYGGESWSQAVSDLNPKLVLEMTATPSTQETILHCYDLREALKDGKYIKNVVCYADQRPAFIVDDWEWDKHTLKEALLRHFVKKSALEAYHANHPNDPRVKPLTLIACRSVEHAQQVEEWLQSNECFGGRFRGKVLRIDNTQPKEEIVRLLEVEKVDNPTEIVVNVGMLREGWDVMNVYVIVPLRAMVSETLAAQTIGRGLRLPFGRRVGDDEVDTLDVLAFGKETVQEVIEAAKQIGVNFRQRNEAESSERVERKVAPLQPLTITIPNIALKVVKPPTLKSFSVKRHVDIDPNAQPKITKIELATGEIFSVDALPIDIPDIPRHMALRLVWHFNELGTDEDIHEATRIFREYFGDIGCTDNNTIGSVVRKWGAEIFQDVVQQVNLWLKSTVEMRYELIEGKGGEVFQFDEVTYSIPAVDGVVSKDKVDPKRHRQTHLVSGWQRSLYPEVKFDTEQELIVMKILDATNNILWIRNPVQQFAIITMLGQHYPDFVVIELKSSRIFLLEIKNIQELSDPNSDAYRKGKAATKWCILASEYSDWKWEYIAIPHNLVTQCTTWEDLKSKRFIFIEADL